MVVLLKIFDDNHSMFEFLGVIMIVWLHLWMHERALANKLFSTGQQNQSKQF